MTKEQIRQSVGRLIEDNYDVKVDRDSRNENILKLFKEGFMAYSPSGARKIESMLLQQIMWRIMDKTKPLDFTMQANRPEEIEQLVTYGVSTMADRSELIGSLRSKQGVWWNSYLFGDSFYMWGTQDNDDIPFIFSVVPNSNVYVDQYCTQIRTTKGRSATKVLVIFSMPPEQGYAMYPTLKKNKVKGQIPREINRIANVETGRDEQQTWKIQNDVLEIGFYFDISNPKNPVFSVIAGDSMEIVKRKQGFGGKNQYPFVLDSQPYIPVGQRVCMPSAQGFYNYGIGDLFFKLSEVSRQLINLAFGHAEESVYPTSIVSIAQGTASDFFATLQEANKAKGAGMKPVVPLEYDPNSPNSNRLGVQTLVTQGAMGEFQAMYDLITREISRCGIVLDDLDLNPQATQYQILAEEEKATAWVKQVQEYNASEWEFCLKVMIDFSKKFIKKSNKSPIDIPVALEVDGQPIKGEFTLGAWSDELKKHNYFPKADSRSGAIPSNVVKQTKLQRVMSMFQPGTPEFTYLSKQFAQLNDVDMKYSQGPTQAPQEATENIEIDAPEVPPMGQQVSPEQVAQAIA
jgi:hypothetical protein